MEKKRTTVAELKDALRRIKERNLEAIREFENSQYFIHAQYSTNEVSGLYDALLADNSVIDLLLK